MMSAPLARTSAGRIAFTVAAVPTGMKAGVRISPRSIWILPVRALPSVAVILKSNRCVIKSAIAARGIRRYGSDMRREPQTELLKLAGLLIASASLGACDQQTTAIHFDKNDRGIAMPEPQKAKREKCYGIARAQFNDCAAGPATDCAGTATKDNMPDRWKYVPTGQCTAQGGTLQPGEPFRDE